jgi:hypothetical protein
MSSPTKANERLDAATCSISMKLLYYSSYTLTAPSYAVSWCLYAAAWSFNALGDALHDATTYKAWLVLQNNQKTPIP